nr:bone morphogenetic protein 5-like [Pelodiscus sinensis]|eukprot:XP_014426499.1 bone morphogenetic protein 5-like [Pelodiscus sinensis]
MLKAELRVFKLNKNHMPQKSFLEHFLKVEVYEVLDRGSTPERRTLISSRLLSMYTEGWEVFNVTQTVSRWVGNSSMNRGFLISTTHVSKNKMEVNFVRFAKSQRNLRDSRNAFLVLFTNHDRQRASHFLPSSTEFQPAAPDDAASSSLPRQNEVLANIRVNKSRRIRDTSAFSPRDPIVPCQLSDLFVDFHEIGWAGWIIFPRGYKAYYCKGACLFPLGESLRATNHATVQSIVHTLKLSKEVSTPCCVPDKLNSISIMYFDDNENVVLKNYKDMVAASCGCH